MEGGRCEMFASVPYMRCFGLFALSREGNPVDIWQ